MLNVCVGVGPRWHFNDYSTVIDTLAWRASGECTPMLPGGTGCEYTRSISLRRYSQLCSGRFWPRLTSVDYLRLAQGVYTEGVGVRH